MPSTLKPLDPTQVELEISITPEEFTAAQDAAFRKLVRNVRVPGFRPGKVPRKIFENTYGSSQILERALDDIVPTKYAAAVEEHGIEPLARPQMELLPEEEGQPLRVKAVVPIRPAIEPKDYTGVEITDVPETATDEDLDRTLEQMRRDAATLVPVERPVKLGDVATLDYQGKIDGVPFDGGAATGQETELTETRFIPGFVAGIVGMQPGETREVRATFPDPYANPDLAGKEAVFTVTVHEVKEPELPPLDDEFAKRVSRNETLEDLRADVKRRLDENVKNGARRRMSGELLDKIVAVNEFPLPEVLIEREIDSLLNDSRQYVARAGIGWDDYLRESGKMEDELRDTYRDEAARRVKTTLLVEAIAKKEGVQATQADVESELDALAAQYGQPRERIVEALQSNVAALIDGIVRTKTIDKLIEQAKRVPAPPATAPPAA
ncbi:trigger factor [Vulcanimicrobium alpinum]|uniref:Trigger factor n=1 Tax=Vulcanimicrobium alpinum TaxID=3016050 RepID=A0AAN2C9D6_UNVUL|nr:trigger factor [Vulcanimicrobium alpinum]BDE06435.1 trigger factor [Vulcanimicrobium alpinum]